jgi:hypothetical protein
MNPQHTSGGGARLGPMRYSAVELLVALVLLFVATPFVQDMRHGEFIEVVLLTLVLVSAFLSIGTHGGRLWIGGLLCITTVVARWSHHFFPDLTPAWLFHAAALPFLVYVVQQILRFILRAPRVTSEVLCAAIAAYLLLGLVWALNYVLVAQLSPDAFVFSAGPETSRQMDSFNAFYFSFVVLSTVGFGDITPISKAARMLAVMEAITGLFYVTVLVARLVAMYEPRGNRTSPPDSEKS